MLNLSDKDLDRLSREAASEHDPGDIIGPRSWDKLEVRLDRHLGHVTPHVARGFYRIPFYYAPVVLMILGASYYFIRNHKAHKEASSGSPPLTLVKPAHTGTDKPSTSSQNPTQTDKSTSTLALPPATAEQPTAPAAGARSQHDLASGGSPTSVAPAAPVVTASGSSSTASNPASGRPSTASAAPGSHSAPASGSSTAGSPASSPATASSAASPNAPGAHNHFTRHRPTKQDGTQPSHSAPASSIGRALARPLPHNSSNNISASPDKGSGLASLSATPTQSSAISALPGERQLSLSAVRGPVPTKRRGSVSDSALRAFTVKATPTPIQRKGGMYINRSLQIGALLAPDFSSVNSMSGDKPGSTIELTADYQFAHHWYIGSGLLFSRKNFAAAPPNFHPPQNYYMQNDMTQNSAKNIDFVKGSFTMLEIPLNLRYDFSVTGNTAFFATAGLSSYLMTSENCDYFYQRWGLPMTQSKNYHDQPNYLFSALNLSVGVEMGVSNSLSVLVAPYVKVPVRNIGFGQVDLSSVGINFALEFAPVLSRRR
jgi:hypothetical protein